MIANTFSDLVELGKKVEESQKTKCGHLVKCPEESIPVLISTIEELKRANKALKEDLMFMRWLVGVSGEEEEEGGKEI